MSYIKRQDETANNRQVGTYYERLAIDYLLSKGYSILKHSYRCKFGEIDIIAKDYEYTVFIEVKYRKSELYGYPRQAVNINKQKHIIRTAMYYIKQNVGYEIPMRFDIVEFLKDDVNGVDKLTHLESAF